MEHLNAVTKLAKEKKLAFVAIEQTGATVTIHHAGQESARRTLHVMSADLSSWVVKQDGLLVTVLDRWTPVLNGEIYCSSACGGRCKKREYDRAVFDSHALLQEVPESIRGNWQARVWENLGWHFSIVCGDASITKSRGGTYMLYWNMPHGQILERGTSIGELIFDARASASARIAEMTETAKTMFGGL